MKQMVALLLLVCIFSACGASETAKEAVYSETMCTEPVWGTTGVETSLEEEISYILNTNTKKIHDLTCYAVDMIKEKNKSVFVGDCEVLYVQGYTLCAHCLDS